MSMPTNAETEIWVWFSLVITTVVIRYVSQYMVRKRTFLTNMPGEDILMAFLVVSSTFPSSTMRPLGASSGIIQKHLKHTSAINCPDAKFTAHIHHFASGSVPVL
ncbi:hypothetical protein LX32DRAFT_633288 [Colletotrichum zoysiae]|uniref:Uncharacterized protein n=1 Tax=Colletotrichum zoysiae TaxID=1216348 RepID=A0AAD9M6R3_9PEZI|nr:hypothetical protein LX32DRAFT_633288 [Colletotrichum zoysiae]